MVKRILALMITLSALQAGAAQLLFSGQVLNYRQMQQNIMAQAKPMGLEDWIVGDEANYSLNMGFLPGTMQMLVREKVEEGFWVDQNIDLGFLGAQKAEMLIDLHTGQILKLIVNGEEQEIPKNDSEVVEVKEDKITVEAGTFDCLWVKLHDKTKDENSEAWINPAEVPVVGMIKQKSPSQFGETVVELTSFKKVEGQQQ